MTEPVPGKNKGGRPTDYRPEYCAKVIELGRLGKSKAQIAAALDVSRQTMLNWTNTHAEFLDAVKRAEELALGWWEDAGQAGLTSKGFNATAFIFQMKNRFREDYRDRQELEHSPGGDFKEVWRAIAMAGQS
jgi:hypothetical protein